MRRRFNAPIPAAHPQNVAGDFYVANDECMSCGAPETQAPTLMSHGEGGHCFFVRQPASKEETDAAILAVRVSCCGAVRYGGQDRDILIRFAELGEPQSCDYKLDYEPTLLNLTYATFKYVEPEDLKTDRPTLARQIMEHLANCFVPKPSSNNRIVDFRCSGNVVSFRHEWGYSGKPRANSATWELETFGTDDWLLRMSKQDLPKAGFAISAHKAMERDSRFRDVRWFSEEEWQSPRGEGRPLPY